MRHALMATAVFVSYLGCIAWAIFWGEIEAVERVDDDPPAP